MTQTFLSRAELASAVEDVMAANTRVIAPIRDTVDPMKIGYARVCRWEETKTGGQLPRRSLKEFFLPPSEVLLQYRKTKDGLKLSEVSTEMQPQVILGALPCDAAGLDILDRVMNWDYQDEFWFGRRRTTTIVSVLCTAMDATCFCTALGLGPDSTRGSDAMLFPVEGGYVVDLLSEKGKALFEGRGTAASDVAKASVESAVREARRKVAANLAAIPAEFPGWLARAFESPLWSALALRCHGCGACASVCPTCHCFDIVDEHDGADRGVRRRNWDSCQTSKFTLHASGHNPRQTQTERYRQRIEHKFSFYPSRFGEVLCTGCGRCSRVCPGGMDLPEVLGGLAAMMQAEPTAGAGPESEVNAQ